MASVRDQIVAAAIVALNTGTPVGVPQAERVRTAAIEPSELPSIIVYPSHDTNEAIGGDGGPLVRARFTMVVECRAAGTSSIRPDQAVDPLYVWVVKALVNNRLPDGAGGFLNHFMNEGDTTFSYEEGDAPYCLAATEMIAVYQHLVGDPESRV